MKVQLHFLKLVYPPISNQEAEWLKEIPEVQEVIKHSNLYMIGQRHESKFIIDEHSVIPDFTNEFSLNFTYSIGDSFTDVTIDFLTIVLTLQIILYCLYLLQKCSRVWEHFKRYMTMGDL